MAKKETKEEEVVEVKAETVIPVILPIAELFGNADLNTLKDKINEIIATL